MADKIQLLRQTKYADRLGKTRQYAKILLDKCIAEGGEYTDRKGVTHKVKKNSEGEWRFVIKD